MQLQLALTVADRLHETLLVRGEPLDAAEAVRLLVACADVPAWLRVDVLQTLVRNDRRFTFEQEEGGLVSLRHWQTPDPDLASVPFVALDLETTGARAGVSKITEVGAVRIQDLQEVKRFSTLVNPLRPIPPMVSQITGITRAMVADAPRIEEVMPQLLEFLEGAVVVAHNASFDVGFLNYELHRLKGKRLGEGAIDTLPLARSLVPGLPNYRLQTVAEALGAPLAGYHRALADAQAVAHVFVTLAGLLRERGITRLGEVRAYASASSRSALDKLGLTRDLPPTPGTFRFLDKDGRTLYVGRADRLGERVRSHFVAGATHTRKVRSAVRLVEHIAWDETCTPLEAVVREQELILEHRPSCNLHGIRPETYTYIKAGGDGKGLSLLASCRPPKWLADAGAGVVPDGRSLVLGPFRKRSRVNEAVELLHRCYPIRRCPRRPDTRPCVRAGQGRCLAPCAADPRMKRRHDGLVTDIVCWLAGLPCPNLSDPLERAGELVRALSRQRRFEEAHDLREATEHLVSVRRSYAALAEAHSLCFAALWAQNSSGGRPSVRVNLVWNGRLQHSATLFPETLEQDVETVTEPLWATRVAALAGGPAALVAVPQNELDTLLAIRSWFLETEHPHKLPITRQDMGPQGRQALKARLVAEASALFSSAPSTRGAPGPRI
jgi:DNA polymerase-3 subunit epsilon